MTIAEAAKALQRGRALPVAMFRELMREYALAVHVEACGHPPIRPTCGLEGAYCERAKRYRT